MAGPHARMPRGKSSGSAGGAPVLPFQSRCFKLARWPPARCALPETADRHCPTTSLPAEIAPNPPRSPGFLTHREKIGRKGLAEFRLHLARILVNAVFYQVHMLQLHRSNGRIPCAGQQREGHQRAIPALNVVPAGIVWMTCFTCSSVGAFCSRWAVAIRVSFSDRLK